MIERPGRPRLLVNLGAADLLQALALAEEDEARQRHYAALLGFAHEPRPPQEPAAPSLEIRGETRPEVDVPKRSGAATLPVRHRARLFGLLEPAEEIALPEPVELPQVLTGLSAEDCQPRLPLAPIRLHPLVPPGRLWPALKRLIQTAGEGALDLPALSRQLARAHVPARLPRCPLCRNADQVVVVLDRARHLAPLAPDMALVAAELARLGQHSGFAFFEVDGHPGRASGKVDKRSASTDSGAQVDAPSAYPPYGHARPLPIFKGARVILVSDLGAARRWPSAVGLSAWRVWLAALERAGSEVGIVSPVSGASLRWPGAHSLAGGRLHRLPRQPGALSPSSVLARALERLKTALSFAVQVEPELLRAMRLADPVLAPRPELESLYLQDEEVSRARSPVLTAEAAGRLRPALARWPVPTQRRVLQVLRAHHAGDYRAVEVMEILSWETHASEEARQAEAEAIAFAKHWMASFEHDRSANPGGSGVRAFGNSVWGRVREDAALQARHSRWLTPLWALDEERRRQPPPTGLDATDLAAVLGEPAALLYCYLVEAGHMLLAQSWPAVAGQSPVAGPFPARTVRILQGGQDETLRVGERQLAFLASLSAGPIEIVLDRHRLRIGELDVPWWALEAGRDGQGAYCLAPAFSGVTKRYALPLERSQTLLLEETGFAIGKGQENGWSTWIDEIGPYVDLTLGPVMQRLRWVPPGDFLMGSPKDEPESLGDEHPQHRVILTEGFWLADTACTQGLWQKVMGGNPSHFKGDPQNPVESVSGDDIQGFLEKLGHLTGVKAELPSEAEWEYACRAGTQTPFWWGDKLTVADANYDGNFPYNDGEKGEDRERTVPVKSFKPNPWGLWQMHGNVWEWCRDGLRDYGEGVVVDPEGPAGDSRALRGGSWIGSGRRLRAAFRHGYPPGYRFRGIGFRFLLRSPGSGARRAES